MFDFSGQSMRSRICYANYVLKSNVMEIIYLRSKSLFSSIYMARFCRKKMISFSMKNLPKNYYFIAVKSCQNIWKGWAKHSFIVIYYICLSVKNTERKAKKKKNSVPPFSSIPLICFTNLQLSVLSQFST